MAGACVLPDSQSPPVPSTADRFSPGGGDAAADVGCRNDLVSGLVYLNIHTGMNPGGELRGQLMGW
ncbi:MAG: CHRD domain-containing protein [Pedosphaera sp.]|nr:CHRD domain-containing protein [Pedosphaera sp.]